MKTAMRILFRLLGHVFTYVGLLIFIVMLAGAVTVLAIDSINPHHARAKPPNDWIMYPNGKH